MADLEKIVRPFQTRVTRSTAVTNQTEPPENIILQFGKSAGSGATTTSGSYSYSWTEYMTHQEHEVSDDGAAGGDE